MFSNKIIIALPLVVGLITKRALFPFRSWLPAAMSAPTPVRALVHRRTLVTSGLWLMIRYHFYFSRNTCLLKTLIAIRLFTIFYRGLNTIFETDIKKLIALRTLRHIGFISLALSRGLVGLAFAHLIVHAMFKRMLFIAIGVIIVNNEHDQDVRYLSKGCLTTKFSINILYVSIMALLGLPIMRSYYTKDLILETLSYCNSSWLAEFFLYISTLFRFFYRIKLFSYGRNNILSGPYKMYNKVNLNLTLQIITMLLINLVSFKILYHFMSIEYIIFVPVNILNKVILFSLLVSIFFL